MASYNGLVAQLILDGSTASEVLGATAVTYVNAVSAVPHKWFNSGLFAVKAADGISGAYSCIIVGAIGGATTVIAGMTGGTTLASNIIGATGSASFGFPRPAYVQVGAADGVLGVTLNVWLAGNYN